MTAPTPMVYYHVGLFGKEALREDCATGTIPIPSLTEAYTLGARAISATAIGPITKLATSFIQR